MVPYLLLAVIAHTPHTHHTPHTPHTHTHTHTHVQWECGTDLALTIINFHKEKNSPITDTTLESISRLFHLYSLPPQTATGAASISLRLIDLVDINPRELFVRAALK